MKENKIMKWVESTVSRDEKHVKVSVEEFNVEQAKKVRDFHKSFPQYTVTPLAQLDELAKELGVSKIWLKDESYRFGLNAFKVLGGAYAIGNYLSEHVGKDISQMPFEELTSEDTKAKLGDVTFVTATDGNHGRGVAWVANQLRQKSVVYMPKGSAQMRFDNIAKEGAHVEMKDMNYDDAVRLANSNAEKYGWVMVQDTAWEGYEDIPLWIMQGYETIIDEIMEQIEESGQEYPTHIILQAGVGSFAGAMQGYVAARFGKDRPITIVVEPHNAACIYKSALEGDGAPHAVTGMHETIMAGLACGEPNTVGWGILRDYADAYVSCDDELSARGMRILSSPLGNDPRVIAGESGSVGLGLLSAVMEREDCKEFTDALKLDKNSRVLLISTEGDTDVDGFKSIVWDGSSPYKAQ